MLVLWYDIKRENSLNIELKRRGRTLWIQIDNTIALWNCGAVTVSLRRLSWQRTWKILQYYSLTTQGKSRIEKSLTMIRTRFLRMAVYAVTQETCGRFTRLRIWKTQVSWCTGGSMSVNLSRSIPFGRCSLNWRKALTTSGVGNLGKDRGDSRKTIYGESACTMLPLL